MLGTISFILWFLSQTKVVADGTITIVKLAVLYVARGQCVCFMFVLWHFYPTGWGYVRTCVRTPKRGRTIRTPHGERRVVQPTLRYDTTGTRTSDRYVLVPLVLYDDQLGWLLVSETLSNCFISSLGQPPLFVVVEKDEKETIIIHPHDYYY